MVKPETVREKSLAPRVGSETKEIENQPRLKKCNLLEFYPSGASIMQKKCTKIS